MRIGPVEVDDDGRSTTLRATITWEDSGRAPFEARLVAASGRWVTAPDPAPFLIPAALVAQLHGEARLQVADPVDPQLVAGLTAAHALLHHWYGHGAGPGPAFETTDRTPTWPPAPRAACLLTGGVDSSALLVANHRRFPPGHPQRIAVGIVAYGFDPSTAGDPLAPDAFLQDLAAATGIELRAVETDQREIEPSWRQWQHRLQAALLVGAAHAAGDDLTRLLVAASDSFVDLKPYGSHPLLDPLLGSTRLPVSHELVHLPRPERTRIVASSPEALASLQVCNRPRTDWVAPGLNCGRCEKCVRTLTGLRCSGVVDPPTFAVPPVEPWQLDALTGAEAIGGSWPGVPAALRAAGEHELAHAAERLVRRVRREEALQRAKDLERSVLGGRVRRAVRVLRRR